MTMTPAELEAIQDALVSTQNALCGYAQLANADETEEHYQTALSAAEAVRKAVRITGWK